MTKSKEKFQERLLLIPIVLLAGHLLIRVWDFAKIMFSYPLYSEAVTQLAQLFFLDVCGFHGYCPYWYNGFTTFLVTPPAWYFFAYPFYWLSQSVLIGAYLSLIATYVIAFLAIYGLGSLIGLTPIKRMLLFVLVFANNIVIKNMTFGRFHEIFAWTMFIIAFLLLIYYKEKRIDKKALLIPCFVAATITAHQNMGILLMVVFAGFVLVKRGKELAKAMGLFVISLMTSAWWLIPAFLEARKNIIANASFTGAEAWWSFPLGTVHFTFAALIALPIITGIIFYRYYLSANKSIKELLFFLPSLGVVAFLFLGLMPFVPIMNVIFTNVYLQFTYILIAFFIIKAEKHEKEYRFFYVLCLTVTALVMIFVNIAGTPWFQESTNLEKDLLELGENIEGKYVFIGSFPATSLPPAYYGYFAIYNNLSTPGGWAPHMRDEEYLKKLGFFKKNEFACEEVRERAEYFGVRYIVAYDQRCLALEQCKFIAEKAKDKVCLYRMAP